MASSLKPLIQTFIAGAAIVKYVAVKLSGDDKTVVTCGAGEEAIGIAQNDASASGKSVEVAMPGGGALWICGETIALGSKLCKSDASGFAVKAGNGDRIVGMVISNGQVLNDVAGAVVAPSIAGAAQS